MCRTRKKKNALGDTSRWNMPHLMDMRRQDTSCETAGFLIDFTEGDKIDLVRPGNSFAIVQVVGFSKRIC